MIVLADEVIEGCSDAQEWPSSARGRYREPREPAPGAVGQQIGDYGLAPSRVSCVVGRVTDGTDGVAL